MDYSNCAIAKFQPVFYVGEKNHVFRLISSTDNHIILGSHKSVEQWQLRANELVYIKTIVEHPSTNSNFILNLYSWEEDKAFYLIVEKCDDLSGESCTKLTLRHINQNIPLKDLMLKNLLADFLLVNLDLVIRKQFVSSGVMKIFSHNLGGLTNNETSILTVDSLVHQDDMNIDIYKFTGVKDTFILVKSEMMEIWKINGSNCIKIGSDEYSGEINKVFVISPNKFIVEIIDFENGDIFFAVVRLQNLNVISFQKLCTNYLQSVFPLTDSVAFLVLQVDDGGGLLSERNYSERCIIWSLCHPNHYSVLADGYSSEDKIALFYELLYNSMQLLVFTTKNNFYVFKLDNLEYDIIHAELRKNARILSQAHRTKTSLFYKLPVEICLIIIAFTDIQKPKKSSLHIASQYFCKPCVGNSILVT